MTKDIYLKDISYFLRFAKKVIVSNDLLMSSTQITKKELLKTVKTIPDNIKVEICLENGFLFITYPSNRGLTRRQDNQ